MTKSDLEKLALLRLEDAIFLLHAKRCSSAYYLAGYSLELALKACIAKLVQPNTIPDKAFVNAIYVHKIDSLLGLSGLRPLFDADAKNDPQLAAHWAIANNWSEDNPISQTRTRTAAPPVSYCPTIISRSSMGWSSTPITT